jgi:hypothetical protein
MKLRLPPRGRFIRSSTRYVEGTHKRGSRIEIRGIVPGRSKRVSGTREKFSLLRWQGSGDASNWRYSSILSGKTGKKGWEWTKRMLLSCCRSQSVLHYSNDWMNYTHSFHGLAQCILPATDLFEHAFFVFKEFIGPHAVGIIVSQQPWDLLATARGERMRKKLDVRLTCEQAFE